MKLTPQSKNIVELRCDFGFTPSNYNRLLNVVSYKTLGNTPLETHILIYHSNCVDGFSAPWAVRYGLGKDNLEFYPARHGTKPPNVRDRAVIMVDFTYPYDAMMSVTRSCSSLTILDHHATAQAALEPLLKKDKVQGRFDMTKSSAILAWEWFNIDMEPLKLLLPI